MSKFKVYIFRDPSQNSKRCRSQGGPREWSDGFESARKVSRCNDEHLVHEGTVASTLLCAEKKIVGEERVVSASGHGSTSWSIESNSEDLHHLASVSNTSNPCVDLQFFRDR